MDENSKMPARYRSLEAHFSDGSRVVIGLLEDGEQRGDAYGYLMPPGAPPFIPNAKGGSEHVAAPPKWCDPAKNAHSVLASQGISLNDINGKDIRITLDCTDPTKPDVVYQTTNAKNPSGELETYETNVAKKYKRHPGFDQLP